MGATAIAAWEEQIVNISWLSPPTLRSTGFTTCRQKAIVSVNIKGRKHAS